MLRAIWRKLAAPSSRRNTSYGGHGGPATPPAGSSFAPRSAPTASARSRRDRELIAGPDGRPDRRPRLFRRHRLLGGLVAAALVLSLVPVALAVMENTTRQVTGEAVKNVRRLPNALPSGSQVTRPARPTAGPAAQALNFLVIGTDAREEEPNGIDPIKRPDEPGGRTDTIMLVHLPVHRRSVYVVSFPRDSWVPIPGHGENKINAAYAYGGSQLLVQTVEGITKTRVDHVVAVDFAGFVQLSDALGGVVVKTESGPKLLRGVEALNFVRLRKNLPRGDLDRVQRQQAYMRALMDKALESESFATPERLNELLSTVADAIQTDDRLTQNQLRDLVISLRHLDGKDVRFLTVPITSLGREQGLSVVRLDEELGASLWPAVREDRIDAWLATHETDTLGNVVEDPIKRRRKPRPSATPTPSAATTAPSAESTAPARPPSSPTRSPEPDASRMPVPTPSRTGR